MDAARWNRIEELLQAALDRDPADRAQFLTAACGSDAALRREVEELLAGESNGEFLSRSPALTLLLAREDLTGHTISHYRVTAKIGEGGMGEVYEAWDETLQRNVALKALPQEFSNDAERVRRFEQEAVAASRLNHPNIVTIFEILHSDGKHFIASERIEGATLRALLEGGPLGVDRALDIAIQVAGALKAAHTAWIIHRDIKPENIMVREDGLVKVVDFGIAKLPGVATASAPRSAARAPSSSPDVTAAGAILGTAKYMSPEQARGEPLDGRTDLYSLGLVLREMLGNAAVPNDLERIHRKLLRENRDERYSTAVELLDDLRAVRRRRESRTARRMISIGVLAVVVAIAVAAVAAVLSVNEVWEERVLRDGHRAAARQAVFSPDGRMIASCGEDGQILVWDFATRRQIATLPAKETHKIAWSPDGRTIATGSIDGTITIWDPATRARLHEMRPFVGEVQQLTFSPESDRLAAADATTSILWDTTEWRERERWAGGSGHGSFIFTGDGCVISSNSHVVYDLASRRITSTDRIGANWIAESPDRSQAVSVDSLGEVSFWRLSKGLHRIDRIPAHQDHGRTTAWSPDGRLVASGAEDVLLWDAQSRRKVARFEYPSIVWGLDFSRDSKWLLTTHGDGAILIWDVADRRCVASLNGHSGSVRGVAFAPDGRRVASAGEDHAVMLWDIARNRKQAVLSRHETRVMGVAFSRDGRRLLSVDQGSLAVVWDPVSLRPIREMGAAHGESSYCLTVSPDGRFLATTYAVHSIDGREIFSFYEVPFFGQIYGADFAPDGRWLATASTTGGLSLWAGWRSGAFRRLEQVKMAGIRLIAVSVSRDSKWLVTGEDQGAVRLWATGPLREVAVLGRHAARVKSVVFSPDGETVASAGDDGMIAFWDLRSRKLRARIGTHASPVYAIAFSPDGKKLVSGEHDRSVRIYTRKRTLWGMELE